MWPYLSSFYYAMRRRLELSVGTVLLLSYVAGIPVAWKLYVSLAASIILIIVGLVNVQRGRRSVPDAAYVEGGPSTPPHAKNSDGTGQV